MKKFLVFLLLLLVTGCSSEKLLEHPMESGSVIPPEVDYPSKASPTSSIEFIYPDAEILGTDEKYIDLVNAVISACYKDISGQSSVLIIPHIKVFQSNQREDGSHSYIGALEEYEYRIDDLDQETVSVGITITFFVADIGNESNCTIFPEQEYGDIIALYPEFQDIGPSITSSIPAIWESESPGDLLKNYCTKTQIDIKNIIEGDRNVAYEDFVNKN